VYFVPMTRKLSGVFVRFRAPLARMVVNQRAAFLVVMAKTSRTITSSSHTEHAVYYYYLCV
jgi:hypothetical protein